MFRAKKATIKTSTIQLWMHLLFNESYILIEIIENQFNMKTIKKNIKGQEKKQQAF
jgi:hypothetical protein